MSPPSSRAECVALLTDFRRRLESLEASDPDESAHRYRSLLAHAPDFSETHYRLARLLERSGLVEESYCHDVAARDHDGFPMRCPPAFQDAYREIASRRGYLLIDGQAYFHAIGRNRISNRRLSRRDSGSKLRRGASSATGDHVLR